VRGILLMIALMAWAGVGRAADAPVLAPPAPWVKPLPVPAAADADSRRPTYDLLTDVQVKFDGPGEQTYRHTAVLIQTPAGLEAAANLSLSWNPETETLIVHEIHIVRGAEVIDVLRTQKFAVLRRETNLERAAIDGVLTATIQLAGVQVGDVLEVAYTMDRHDPTMHGHSEATFNVLNSAVTQYLRLREVWPATKTIRWRETDDLSPAVVTKGPQESELVVEERKAERPKPPKGAPGRYSYQSMLEATDFAHWSDASALLSPYFAKAATLGPNSPLKAEALKIRAASSDPKVQAAAALKLVQDQIRYLFLGMNLGGYVPADADLTWSRRFGDCKGKTVVLLALLHELGIDAEPVLVNSSFGDGMDERLPSIEFFDHVIVRARIAGNTYWLDGTSTGDRALDTIEPPPFHWGLPLEPQGAELVKIEQRPLAAPMMSMQFHIDASAGLDAVAPVHFDTVFGGALAVAMKIGTAATPETDLDKALLDAMNRQYPWMEFKSVKLAFDDATGEEHLIGEGAASLSWPLNQAAKQREYEVTGADVEANSRLSSPDQLKRDPGPHIDAPYTVTLFPYALNVVETIALPANGKGFSVFGDDVDTTVGGVAYKRSGRIDGGVFTLTFSARGVAPEFPAAEAPAVNIFLRKLTNANVRIRAPQAYTPGDAELQLRLGRTPTLASEFSDRAEARLLKRDYDGALQDYDAALKLKPDDADLLNGRCFARGIANRALDGAMTDCNAAIDQQPQAAAYLDSRGFIYFRQGQMDKALADLNAALAVAPDQAPSLYVRGLIERRAGDGKHGDADIASAKSLDPTVVATYAGYGVGK
jgi:tetratricopeptide (TPR) repeat protein